ncbi:MAG: pantoate kinase [Candidatus Methanospirare jalkutatii]|nr:MAG: pantoate kinase [Candidatus Methanospirare jalkutatii]
MRASAYAPSHISGFFEICENENPLEKGSVGCGVLLSAGCFTEVRVCECEETEIRIRINGREENAPTTRFVVEKMLASAASAQKRGAFCVLVNTRFEVPLRNGFGASGAGALSTALALNDALSLRFTLNELAQIAHLAEIENSTGLGDVVAETFGGGVVIRKKAGAPGIGEIDRIPTRSITVSYAVLGKGIETRRMLRDASHDKELRRRINNAGKASMRELLREPTIENFMRCSQNFALKTGLASERCVDAIEAVAAEGKIASVAMLGETVFVVGESEALREFGDVKTSKISFSGAKLL